MKGFWVLTIMSARSPPDEGILEQDAPNAAIHPSRKSIVPSLCLSDFHSKCITVHLHLGNHGRSQQTDVHGASL